MKKTLLFLACHTFSAAVFSQTKLPDCQPETIRHNCFGEFIGLSGGRYAGQWSSGQYAGLGTYTAPNGDRYVGQFKDNQYNGRGTYYYSNGDRYVGEVKNGNKHGTGILYSANGNILLDGIWKQDKFITQADNQKIPRDIALAWKGRIQKEISEMQQKHEYASDWSKLISKSVSQVLNQWLDDDKGLNIQEIPPPKLPAPVSLTQDKWESDSEFTERLRQQQELRQKEVEKLIDSHNKLKEQRERNLKQIQAEKAAKQKLLPWVSQEFLQLAMAMETPRINPVAVNFDSKSAVLYFDLEIGGQVAEKYEFKEALIELRKAALTDLKSIQFNAESFANLSGGFGINGIRIYGAKVSAYGTLVLANKEKQSPKLFNIETEISPVTQLEIVSNQAPRPFVQIEVPGNIQTKPETKSIKKIGIEESETNQSIPTTETVDMPDVKTDVTEKRQEQIKRLKVLSDSNKASIDKSFSLSVNYMGRLRARVRPNIVFSDSQLQGVKGNPEAEIIVICNPSGLIVHKKLNRSSGNKAWDEAVLNAIEKTGILPRDENGNMPSQITFAFRPRDQ